MNRKRFLSFYTYAYMYNNYKHYKTHAFLYSPRSVINIAQTQDWQTTVPRLRPDK